MKFFIDQGNQDFVEIKSDNAGNIDLSIRTKKDEKSGIVITAKMNLDLIDKLIANLILLKSRVINEK